MGGLIILIGPNNSGKSNIIDSFKYFSNKNSLEERDITNLEYDKKYKNPNIVLQTTYADDSIENLSINLNSYSHEFIDAQNYKKMEEIINKILVAEYDELNEIKKIIQNNDKKNYFNLLKDLFKNYKITNQQTNEIVFTMMPTRFNTNDVYLAKFLLNNNIINDNDLRLFNREEDQVENYFDISIYNEKQKFKNENLVSNYQHIYNNVFYINLFKKIDFDPNSLTHVYQEYKNQNNKGLLKDIEKKLNEKLKRISKQFNKLYSFNDETYKFEVDLESEKINLIIWKNNKPITLDYQSDGFKWFFNIYFNYFGKDSFKTGDIIVMDEPGTNIHPSGQKILRNFLKDFALKNKITIIISTHSPFMIDLDNLDEIRVINSIDNKVNIINEFHQIESDDENDIIRNIKDSLTVHNNVLFSPDNKILFVEGITDYNYLTGMKRVLNENEKYNNIIFIPINGLGINDTAMKKTIQNIIKIRKNKSYILVDNDNAGEKFNELNKKLDTALNVFCLKEIDQNFKTIESLFDDEDQKKWSINLKNKTFKNSVSFKLNANKNRISKKSFDNFIKLFEFIERNW